MFKIRNGRIWYQKLSFVLPEGFIFNNDSEACFFNGFSFLSPSGYILDIQIIPEKRSTFQTLNKLCMEMGAILESDIQESQLKGLYGNDVHYHFGSGAELRSRYYEARYKLNTCGHLVILVHMDRRNIAAHPNLTTQKILKSKVMREFLSEVRMD